MQPTVLTAKTERRISGIIKTKMRHSFHCMLFSVCVVLFLCLYYFDPVNNQGRKDTHTRYHEVCYDNFINSHVGVVRLKDNQKSHNHYETFVTLSPSCEFKIFFHTSIISFHSTTLVLSLFQSRQVFVNISIPFFVKKYNIFMRYLKTLTILYHACLKNNNTMQNHFAQSRIVLYSYPDGKNGAPYVCDMLPIE